MNLGQYKFKDGMPLMILARFIGHPNYFIAPFIFLAWWMESVRGCLESLGSILSAKHLTFQMDGDDHIMEVGRFGLDSLYDPAFEDQSLFRNTH